MTLNFEYALTAMKEGKKVARSGWNGVAKGMVMTTQAQFPDENSKMKNPYFYMSVDGVNTPWHPSNLDLFAEDWEIIS